MSNFFRPVSSKSPLKQIVTEYNRAIQRLDGEAQTKIISGPNGSTAVLFGMRPDGTFGMDFSDSNKVTRIEFGQTEWGFGFLLYDSDGTARVLVGNAPPDGRVGIWVSDPGVDVIEELTPDD